MVCSKFVLDTMQKATFIVNQKFSVDPKQVEKFLKTISNFKEMDIKCLKKKKNTEILVEILELIQGYLQNAGKNQWEIGQRDG